MDDHKETQLAERLKNLLDIGKKNSKRLGKIISLVLCVIAVISIAITIKRSNDYGKVKDENKKLQEELSITAKELENKTKELETTQTDLASTKETLSYTETQHDLLKESESALIAQVGEMEEKISELEELLNVRDAVPQITRNQLEEQLTSIGELVTAKYFFRNAARKEASKTWLWGWTMPFSDASLLATYDGTIKAGIDFDKIDTNVNETKREITITLPDSRVTDNNIPQETINVLEVKNNLFNEISFNDYNKFISEEKSVMEERAIEQGLLVEAHEEAKAVIRTFLSQMPGMDTYTLVVQ